MISNLPDTKPAAYRLLTMDGQRTLQSLSSAVANFVGDLTKLHVIRTCISCDHFDEKSELCRNLKVTAVPARPPARVIAFGCHGWENIDDDIPF